MSRLEISPEPIGENASIESCLIELSEKDKLRVWGEIVNAIGSSPEIKSFLRPFENLKINLEFLFQAYSNFGRAGVHFVSGSKEDFARLQDIYGERDLGADYNPLNRTISRYGMHNIDHDVSVALRSLARFGCFKPFRERDGSLSSPLPIVIAHELIHDEQWYQNQENSRLRRTKNLWRPASELQAHSGMSSYLQDKERIEDLIAVSCTTPEISLKQIKDLIVSTPEKFLPMLDIYKSMTNLRAIGWSEVEIAGLVRGVDSANSYEEGKDKFMRGYNQGHVQNQLNRGLKSKKIGSFAELREKYHLKLREQEQAVKNKVRGILRV